MGPRWRSAESTVADIKKKPTRLDTKSKPWENLVEISERHPRLAALYGMKPDLLTAERGVNEDDLHEAVAELIPRLPHVKNVLPYLTRVVFRKRLKRVQTRPAYSPLLECLSPEDPLCQEECIVSVRRAIEQLPVRERHVVRLHYLNGEACDAIARRLGWSLCAVRSVLFRARRRLADSLAYTAGDDREKRRELGSALTRPRQSGLLPCRHVVERPRHGRRAGVVVGRAADGARPPAGGGSGPADHGAKPAAAIDPAA